MRLSVELQLLALIIALYVHDSYLLLFSNEGVLTTKRKDGWSVMFGSDNARFRGKELYFPNLFLVHRPLFRLSWSYEATSPARKADWKVRRVAFDALIPVVYAIGFAQFFLFPFVLFFQLTNIAIITSLGFLYGSISIGLIYVILNRKEFGMSNQKLISLCFECLICPPVAVNLIRKLSLVRSYSEDLVSVSRALLAEESWHAAKAEFLKRLDEEINAEDEESIRFTKLRQRRENVSND